ncbi:hypothetical protein Hanom_Chr05g00401221 [Helianthus anomalus]
MNSCHRAIGGVVGERFGVICDSGSTFTLPVIYCSIQLKGKYRWCRFILDRRRGLTDYSTLMPSQWMSGFRTSGRGKRLAAPVSRWF